MSQDLRYRVCRTKLGFAGFAESSAGLVRVWLPMETEDALRVRIAEDLGDAQEAQRLNPELSRQLVDYFAGKDVVFTCEFDRRSLTEFQARVHDVLLLTARGETVSYGELAQRAGSPGAARGVGAVMAANPYPPVVPCHRVLGADGALRGYSGPGGLTLKAQLLGMEGAGALLARGGGEG